MTGGGGEGSFHTQAPQVQLSSLIKGGVTTVLGLLGTDGISRSVENLLAKVKALKEEGISAMRSAEPMVIEYDRDRKCQQGHHVYR